MGFSAGFLIYSGVMPLLKMFITIFLGFWLARKDLFPPGAFRGASQITMNIALPGLIFSSVVPAFTSHNVSAMGPLFLQAFFYIACGGIFGVIIREVCYVPRNFWQGIIVATALSNWSSLPTAIVLTVTESQPFNADSDPALGVSFVAIFIVSYNMIMWIAGAANSLAWDFGPGVPQGEAAFVRVGWREKPVAALFFRLRDKYMPLPKSADGEKDLSMTPGDNLALAAPSRDDRRDHTDVESIMTSPGSVVTLYGLNGEPSAGTGIPAPTSSLLLPGTSSTVASSSKLPLVTIAEENPEQVEPTSENEFGTDDSSVAAPDSTSSRPSASVRVRSTTSSLSHPDATGLRESEEQPLGLELLLGPTLVKILQVTGTLLTPITMALYISLTCALIPHLKAFFVNSDEGPQYQGPDGNPPLTFVIQTAQLVGSIAVPMALLLLGASFARMKIPKPLSKLPIPAILAVTFAKLALLPVIGIVLSQGLVRHGLVPKDALVERFVGMLLSGTPTAVNQLVVTQLYAKDPSDVDTLCAFLLVQYTFMFISTAVITAVSLALL